VTSGRSEDRRHATLAVEIRTTWPRGQLAELGFDVTGIRGQAAQAAALGDDLRAIQSKWATATGSAAQALGLSVLVSAFDAMREAWTEQFTVYTDVVSKLSGHLGAAATKLLPRRDGQYRQCRGGDAWPHPPMTITARRCRSVAVTTFCGLSGSTSQPAGRMAPATAAATTLPIVTIHYDPRQTGRWRSRASGPGAAWPATQRAAASRSRWCRRDQRRARATGPATPAQ
jgi:hypothetical protein